jgi:hypothetical protein
MHSFDNQPARSAFCCSDDILQAVVFADSFAETFRPITLEQPKVQPNSLSLLIRLVCAIRLSRSSLFDVHFTGFVASGECAADRVYVGISRR